MNDLIPVWGEMGIISCTPVTPGVFELWLDAPVIAQRASPGQFVMIKCGNATFLRRPLSIHRVSPERTRIALLFAVAGQGTLWLSQTQAGMSLDVLGPLGTGFKIEASTRSVLLVAGGLGWAPLYFLAEQARMAKKRVALLIGAATAGSLYPVDRLPQAASCLITTDDGSCGRSGFVTEHLAVCAESVDQVFACGPLPMLSVLVTHPMLSAKNLQVSLETRMACGLGICYGCTIETRQGLKQVCKHGPVFNAEDVIWEKLKPV